MIATEYSAYGGPEVIRFVDRPIPTPGEGEVLVRVSAAPVTAGDVRLRSGKAPRGMGTLLRLALGWRRPRLLPGWGFAGQIAALGPKARGYQVGDRVFGLMGMRGGAHAEYLLIKAGGTILPLPDSLTMAEGAAFFFGGLTAQHYLLDRGGLVAGESVLIHGASGAVGTAAVQIAAHLGARVTATASARNHEDLRRLGAAVCHDYRDGPAPGRFDLILDVFGNLGWRGARSLLQPKGRLCLITADLAATLGAGLWSRRGGRRVHAGVSSEAPEAMARLLALHHAGFYRPWVSQTMDFADLAKAHALAETFHKPGNLVVTMARSPG